VRWDPNKKPPGGKLFLLIGGWTHCFTILFSYYYYLFTTTTIKNPFGSTQKNGKSHTHPSNFFGGGRFSYRNKGLPPKPPKRWFRGVNGLMVMLCDVLPFVGTSFEGHPWKWVDLFLKYILFDYPRMVVSNSMGCSSLQVDRIKSLAAKLGVRPLNLSKRMD
jgi:hypothetical protein